MACVDVWQSLLGRGCICTPIYMASDHPHLEEVAYVVVGDDRQFNENVPDVLPLIKHCSKRFPNFLI